MVVDFRVERIPIEYSDKYKKKMNKAIMYMYSAVDACQKDNEKYAEEFVNMVVNANQTYNKQWIRSVLQDENAWYLPIPYSEMEINSKLEQNPYYQTTK